MDMHLFTDSSVNKDLGCLHLIDVVTKCSYIYTSRYKLLFKHLFSLLLVIYLGMKLLCVAFRWPLKLFPQWPHQFTFPPTNHKGSNFSPPSQHPFSSFIISHLGGCGVSHCGFDL